MTKNSKQEIKELKQEILELQCIVSCLTKIDFWLEEELNKEEKVAEVVSIPEAIPVCSNKIPANLYTVKQNESDCQTSQPSSSYGIHPFKLHDIVIVANDRVDSKGIRKGTKGTVVDFRQNFVYFQTANGKITKRAPHNL